MAGVLGENLYVRDAVARWRDESFEYERLVAAARAKGRDPKRSVLIERQLHLVFQLRRTVEGAAQIAVTGRAPFEVRGERGERLRADIDDACRVLMDECAANPAGWDARTRMMSDVKDTE